MLDGEGIAARRDVDALHEQPLPWRVPEVYVSFWGGSARACRVTRQPGDILRLDLTGVNVSAGAQAEVQWTQNRLGCYLSATVVAAPDGAEPGVYLEVNESMSGVQRRLGVRVDVQVPVAVTVSSGRTFAGRTVDLSVGGAHILADLGHVDEETVRLLGDDLTGGAHIDVEVTLPDGPAQFACQVTAVGNVPGDTRVWFVDVGAGTEERLVEFLRVAQRRAALRKQRPATAN